MPETRFDRQKVIRYLVWTFALAYAIQTGVGILYRNGQQALGQLVMAAMMFVPTLGVLLAGGRLTGLGWKPRIRRNVKAVLFAWLAPVALTALGAALYFCIFPGHFDLTGSGMADSLGQQALEQLAAQGISYPMYVLIAGIGCLTYAPLLNMFLALGEEIGWRGFLYPQLKARFGRRRGWLLGGFIWGAWHWPLIWCIGYEYGAGYPGFPVVGMLLFSAITVGWGILHDRLYERTGSIWLPSLLHGALNAAATLPAAVCISCTGVFRLLGPAPNGLIAGLPFLTLAGALLARANRDQC